MTITSNTTLVRIFLNSDVEIKKLKKKRYLIKVTLDNGMVIQLNDVPFEINNEFIDFKLNNSNQMIAKQLVDTANAVLIKTPSSFVIKTEEVNEETNQPIGETKMENNELFNQVKEIISGNEDFMNYFKSENVDMDVAITSLILPLKAALEHISDEKIKENMVNAFLASLKKNNEDKDLTKELNEVLKAKAALEEKLTKVPLVMEINRQGAEQLKDSCEKLSQETEEVVSGKQSQKQSKDEKSSLDNKEFAKEETLNKLKNNPEEAKLFCDNKAEESTLYSVAKTVGKVAGVAALGVVGFLAYGFIKSKLD